MTIAIGDIHGCLQPLKLLIAKLPPDEPLVFLGDYIDRGSHSRQVVSFLQQVAQKRTCQFLMGNHEHMMLNASQETYAASWLQNGGLQTLYSYQTDPLQWISSSNKLAFLQDHLSFFQQLKPFYEDQDAIYVHAGIDPHISSLQQQKMETLLWIREEFFENLHLWQGKTIIFGHTPTERLGAAKGSLWKQPSAIGIDTGCVFGGALTAFHTKTHKIWRKSDTSIMERHLAKQKKSIE